MSRTRMGAALVIVGIAAFAVAACSVSTHLASSRTGAPKPGAAAPTPKPTTTKPVQPISHTPVSGKGPGGSMISTGNKAVALTFDDGPDAVDTPKMLDVLKKNGVKATFCLVGQQAYGHPDLVRRIVKEGHTICNHSWRHRLDLAKQSTEVILKDLQDTTRAILRAAPNAKIKYFRAPGGNYTSRLVQIAASLGLRSLYWSVDPQDWNKSKYGTGAPMVRHVIAIVKANTRPGAIVLSHDYKKPDTVTAYASLLPWLKSHFKLIPLPT